jgi:UDP-GlcNAc:undecaprenyl-phosphate GlcNAc-1-phosphate transferase
MPGVNYYLSKIIEALIISVAVAFVASPLSIRIANKLGVIDRPKDARRVHKKPIPRFGGMAIFLGSMAAMLIPAGMNEKIKPKAHDEALSHIAFFVKFEMVR